MSTRPPLPSQFEVESDALALVAATLNDDADGRRVILRQIEENVQRGVPWQVYVAGLAAKLSAYLVVSLNEQGTDPAEWIAAKQAGLRSRLADGTADGE